MNPLTQIRNTQKATRAEVELGLGDRSSWHHRFKHSAYVFAGGLPYELTEGDLLAVFSQYGEILDVHLVRDKDTHKSKGFAFLAYEDQRSTVLAVDNLSGARVAGRTIRVEHVDNYKKKRAEVEGEALPSGGEEEDRLLEDVHRRDHFEGAILVQERRPGPATDTVDPDDAPWLAGNSVAALMQEARAQGLISRPWRAGSGDGDGGDRRRANRERTKEGRHERNKEKKKHRRRSRSRSRSPHSHRRRHERGEASPPGR